jgi:WD40 repeat protein/tRNA A-37 threonylcarbamoyl transferase component Bud32
MEKIGEGGFGLVFVAEQQVPVRRRVALKVIKPGMDTRDAIARFEAERQALALMDHPNIARVLEAGATESGRPYFVMELVRGIPITDYCDENRLTPRERLELFVSVCQAVQHAHQKGIIHRDIKPSNVLVTLQDGRPLAKVIDFGVAKALHQPLTEKTIYTRFAQMVGTPLYMSPEQAAMSSLDIDTRTDIYSLGVLMYELLTGTTPFDKKRVAKAAYDELVRMIREEEPAKPSTRLSQSTASLPVIASQRSTEPARLSKMFRGDLDWITMKALEKDRTRRYESASGLAADVTHYLHDEPVEAGPPSARYRLRKFARRYRRGLQVAGALALLLVAGAAFSAWEAVQARRAERSALQQRDRAVVAEAAAVEAEAAAMAARGAESAQRKKAQLAQRVEGDLRLQAQLALDRSEHNLYFNRIALAERYWQASNQGRTDQILNACPANLRDWEWNYLKRLGHSEELTLAGDQVAYSPDGQLMATDGKDNSVQVRDARNGRIVVLLRGDNPSAFAKIAFGPDSHRLAANCEDRTIRIWDLPGGRQTLKLQPPTSSAAARDPHHIGSDLAFSPDGKRIAMAGAKYDRVHGGTMPDYLSVWDAVTGKELLKLPAMGVTVAFSPDGKRLATDNRGTGTLADLTGTLCILDADTGHVVNRAAAFAVNDNKISYSPDGKWLVSARQDEIKIREAKTGNVARTLRGHTQPVTALSFSGDGKRLASASEDETVRIWDLARGETLFVFRGHVGPVAEVSFHPDGQFVASSGKDETVRVWDATAAQDARQIPGTRSVNYSVGFSPDGRYIAMLHWRVFRLVLVLVDATTGRHIRVLRAAPLSSAWRRSPSASRRHPRRGWAPSASSTRRWSSVPATAAFRS